jgi:signal transduction histidine kinase
MMRKFLLFCLLIIAAGTVSAQFTVNFTVREATAIKHDSVYITGTFADWDSSANPKYLLQNLPDGRKFISLKLPAGEHRYKFTRGGWLTVEKGLFGSEIADKIINVTKDTAIEYTIEAYRDQILSDKWTMLATNQQDTTRVISQIALSSVYGQFPEWYNFDSALYYNNQALSTLQRIKDDPALQGWIRNQYKNGRVFNQNIMAILQQSLGNYSKALELRLDNLIDAEKARDTAAIINVLWGVSNLNWFMRDYHTQIAYGRKILQFANRIKGDAYFGGQMTGNLTIAIGYTALKQFDSALYYAGATHKMAVDLKNSYFFCAAGQLLGDISLAKGKTDVAFEYYHSVLPISFSSYAVDALLYTLQGLSRVHDSKGNLDSALYYGKRSLDFISDNQILYKSFGYNPNVLTADFTPFMAELHKKKGQNDSAYYYLKLSAVLRDSIFTMDKIAQFQNLTYNESLRKEKEKAQLKAAQDQFIQSAKTQLMVFGLLILFAAAFYFFWNNLQRKKANSKLESQKNEIEKTLSALKVTQNQLVQSEKMASLGELTAGIAHEIQNPLNFVNNFSEVNRELLAEMKNEMSAGNYDEAALIANDVISNEEKITEHGKRADSIVKNMLQHSRVSMGQKEKVDINALADEYLRLSYHGLRAKDKTFNAHLKTVFDDKVGHPEVIPQDIGRVMLNLYNNAFFAVAQKSKTAPSGYEPTVTVTTLKTGNTVSIKVTDNGAGIPASLKDKIFQPFFTTKPSGQGTGLGLSLSYDIITKGHGGELLMESVPGEGTVFEIRLPV